MTNGGASTYRCNRCDRYFTEQALKQIRAGSGFLSACPTCGDVVHKEISRVARPLAGLLAGAFAYPFRGSTLMWVAGMLVGTTILRFIPWVGGLLAISAEIGFFFAILKSTADGKDELDVEASDLSDVSTWLGPLFKLLIAVAVSFCPSLAAAVLLRDPSGAVTSSGVPIVYGLAMLGLAYLPAALIVAANAGGCLGVLNPVAGLTLIARIPGAYAVTLAFLAIAVAVGAAMMAGASSIEIPVAGLIARSVASFFAPLVAMRMLGLMMSEHAEEL